MFRVTTISKHVLALNTRHACSSCVHGQDKGQCSSKIPKEKPKKYSCKSYSLKDVVENGLCMGCGLCVSLANDGAVDNEKFLEMRVVPPGRYRPIFLKHRKDPLNGHLVPVVPNESLILKVCPGINVDVPGKNSHTADSSRNSEEVKSGNKEHYSVKGYVESTGEFLGPTRSVRKCYASDPDVRFRAAAAGGITALSEYLLSSKQVDFIHHVRANEQEPMLSVIQKSTCKSELLKGSQSRYGPAAPLECILQILQEKRTFAFVGKPCDINGLKNLAKFHPDVDKYVKFTMTISCGMIPDQSMYLDWLKENRIRKEDLVEFRYRGNGCPGASPYAKYTTEGDFYALMQEYPF